MSRFGMIRSGLPIDDALPAVSAALRDPGHAVLTAPPGSGKTTIVPLALLEEDWILGRILVLEPRPGRVRELIEVPVPRPRSHDQMRAPEFVAIKKHLETIIHPEDAQPKPQFDKLPMARLTVVGDEVE